MILHPRDFLKDLNSTDEDCINYYKEYIKQVSEKIDEKYPNISSVEKELKIKNNSMVIDYSVARGSINLIKYFHEEKGHKINLSWFDYWCRFTDSNEKVIFDYCNAKSNYIEYLDHFDYNTEKKMPVALLIDLIKNMARNEHKKDYIFNIRDSLDMNSNSLKIFNNMIDKLKLS